MPYFRQKEENGGEVKAGGQEASGFAVAFGLPLVMLFFFIASALNKKYSSVGDTTPASVPPSRMNARYSQYDSLSSQLSLASSRGDRPIEQSPSCWLANSQNYKRSVRRADRRVRRVVVYFARCRVNTPIKKGTRRFPFAHYFFLSHQPKINET